MLIKIFCLLFLFASNLYAISKIQIRKLFKAGQFKKVVSIYEKYPSKFNEGILLRMLSLSYQKLNKKEESVASCTSAAINFEDKYCYKYLQKIKNDDLKTYQFGLAIHHYHSGNSSLAFQFFYKVIDQDPEHNRSRAYLFKIMRQMKQSDYAWEQYDLLSKKPKFIRKAEKRFKRQISRQEYVYTKLNQELIIKDHNVIYFYLLSTTKPIRQDALKFLKDYYQQRLDARGADPKLLLRMANLIHIGGDSIGAKDFLLEIEDVIGKPVHLLSMDSLYRRIEKKIPGSNQMVKNRDKSLEVEDSSSTQKNKTPSIKLSFDTANYKSLHKQHNLSAIPSSDINLATVEDLSPIHAAEKEVYNRLSKDPSDYEKRWILKEIDRIDNELLSNENTATAREAFLKSERGQALTKQVERLEKELRRKDKQNAKIFQGEHSKFKKSMKSAQSIQEQRRAFLGWVDRWYRLSNSKNINLETQGAINAYQKTPEGQRLSKDVIEMGLKLKMKPANLDLPDEFLHLR